MTRPRHVVCEQQGGTLIVAPAASAANLADAEVAAEWSAAQHRLDEKRIRNLVVDLSALPYFGSTILECLTQMWKVLKAKNGKLAIAGASRIGREVLAAARLDKLWRTCDTRREALDWLDQ